MSFVMEGDGSGTFYLDDRGFIHIEGKIRNATPPTTLVWWAAAPADHRTSFTGSGLPFPNAQTAYENTPNHGRVELSPTNGASEDSAVEDTKTASFDITLNAPPNAYYVSNGTIYLNPRVHLRIERRNKPPRHHEVTIMEGIPYRMLSYPNQSDTCARHNATFYRGRFEAPFDTQEAILRRSGFPSTQLSMPKNFWGLATPHP